MRPNKRRRAPGGAPRRRRAARTPRRSARTPQQVNQANQQLASAQLNADRDHTQAQSKIQSDDNQIQSAQSNLANLEATEASSGGTYTWLPKVGDLIHEDQPVYSISNQPVPLLYGSVAAYRAFYVGMSDGADVGQLTHDLIALGYGAGLTQSNHYSSATATAVERWQTALGLPATGDILLGQVVFEPGPIRVTSVTPSVGASAGGGGGSGGSGGGTVLTATSTTPIVTVALEVTQEYLVKPGDAVIDRAARRHHHRGRPGPNRRQRGHLPGRQRHRHRWQLGRPVAVFVQRQQQQLHPDGDGHHHLGRTPPGATLDQAPVNVNITTQRADNVLAVPVNALLALEGGGFGVDVVTGSTSRLVGVTTGLYSNTLVQISGPGITAGTRVEVPSS